MGFNSVAPWIILFCVCHCKLYLFYVRFFSVLSSWLISGAKVERKLCILSHHFITNIMVEAFSWYYSMIWYSEVRPCRCIDHFGCFFSNYQQSLLETDIGRCWISRRESLQLGPKEKHKEKSQRHSCYQLMAAAPLYCIPLLIQVSQYTFNFFGQNNWGSYKLNQPVVWSLNFRNRNGTSSLHWLILV